MTISGLALPGGTDGLLLHMKSWNASGWKGDLNSAHPWQGHIPLSQADSSDAASDLTLHPLLPGVSRLNLGIWEHPHPSSRDSPEFLAVTELRAKAELGTLSW